MRSLFFMGLLTLLTSVLLVSCNNKDEGNKDTEIMQAKQAYDRCVSIKGQAYCNSARVGSIASVSEFYGQSYYYNFYGYNNLAANTGSIYTQEQLNTYFDNYMRNNTKQDIMQISNRWYQMSTEIGTINTLNYGRRCTAYGCY